SALISPDATAVASALRKTVPPPHESLLTSIGLLDRVTLLVPGTPSVAVPPQLPLPLPGRLSAALTTRSPTGSMSMMPPPPPPAGAIDRRVPRPRPTGGEAVELAPVPAAFAAVLVAPGSLSADRTVDRHWSLHVGVEDDQATTAGEAPAIDRKLGRHRRHQ